MKGQAPTTIIKQHFSKRWLRDARIEAQINSSNDARRREILFSICFAESYLFEWVRDDLLNGSIEKLSNYFPPGARTGVKSKWKETPRQLRKDGLIADTPDLGRSFWSDFCVLVDLRDGLVHARASRPSISGQSDAEQPRPGVDELDEISAGWALSTVLNLVKDFHDSASVEPPEWIEHANCT